MQSMPISHANLLGYFLGDVHLNKNDDKNVNQNKGFYFLILHRIDLPRLCNEENFVLKTQTLCHSRQIVKQHNG